VSELFIRDVVSAGSNERGNEPSGCMKGQQFLELCDRLGFTHLVVSVPFGISTKYVQLRIIINYLINVYCRIFFAQVISIG
jgi:hypothetical protein